MFIVSSFLPLSPLFFSLSSLRFLVPTMHIAPKLYCQAVKQSGMCTRAGTCAPYTSILLYVDCNKVKRIGSRSSVRTLLSFSFRTRENTHFAPSSTGHRETQSLLVPAANKCAGYTGISSYRKPLYLMHDPANAIDKAMHHRRFTQ